MDILFNGLLERARYYEQFEQFRKPDQLSECRENSMVQIIEG
jgi:hypothetical protein